MSGKKEMIEQLNTIELKEMKPVQQNGGKLIRKVKFN